jgi:hypothetical protein
VGEVALITVDLVREAALQRLPPMIETLLSVASPIELFLLTHPPHFGKTLCEGNE